MTSTTYYWDELSDNVVLEEDENGDPIAQYVQEPGQYGQLISQQRDGQAYYHHYDGRGDTRAVTDENEEIVETATYSAFGEVVEKTTSIINPFGYKGALGYYANAETTDIYVRARTYQPTLMRWMSVDPLRIVGRLNHAYLYSSNNPIVHDDPSGMLWRRGRRDRPIFRRRRRRCCTRQMLLPSCEDICKMARESPDEELHGQGGTIICFSSKKCACLFPYAFYIPFRCPDLDRCAIEHEKLHFPEVECDQCGLYRPPPKPGVNVIEVECKHRKETVKCLEAVYDRQNSYCKSMFDAGLRNLRDFIAEYCEKQPAKPDKFPKPPTGFPEPGTDPPSIAPPPSWPFPQTPGRASPARNPANLRNLVTRRIH